MGGTTTCTQCGQEGGSGQRFCGSCGGPLGRPCGSWRRVGLWCGRLGLALSAFVLPIAGLALWSASGVAHACDPATGVGCDTTPPSGPPATAANSPPAPPQPQPPRTTRGGPFIPGASQPSPQSPAPEPPTSAATQAPTATAAPRSTQGDQTSTSSGTSGGGGGGWAKPVVAAALGGAGALVAGGAGVSLARNRNKPDPVAGSTSDQPIKYDGLIGDAVTRDPSGAVSAYNAIPIQANPEVFAATHQLERNTDARTKPDPGADASGTLERRLEVQVLERRGSWARVRCSNGWEGWIDGRDLKSR